MEKYASTVLRIKPKTVGAGLIPFKLNTVQKKLHAIIEKHYQETGKVRVIILKGRQFGVSTYVQGRFFRKSATTPAISTLTVTHEREATELLFKMNTTFWENLPTLQGVDFQMPRTASNKKEIIFAPPLSSYLAIDTAGESMGRSATFHCLHASEVPYWKDAESSFLSAFQSVPDAPGTEVIIEGTANGTGNYFYKMYWEAKEGKNEFLPIFLSWAWHDEYQRPLPDGFEITLPEFRLMEKYGLSKEQIAWRRWAIANKCQGSEEKFMQEYPLNEEEAFLTSGRPFLGKSIVRRIQPFPKIPILRGRMGARLGEHGNVTPEFIAEESGTLTVWRFPEEGRAYDIGADVGGVSEESDFHAAYVVDHVSGETCAEFWGHCDPDVYAEQLALLGEWYNWGVVAVENNPGQKDYGPEVIRLLVQDHSYPNLYHHAPTTVETTNWQDTVGWNTNTKTRPILMGTLLGVCRDAVDTDRILVSKGLVEELTHFVIGENGKPQAEEGHHDDRVMGFAIAQTIRQLQPFAPSLVKPYHVAVKF